MEIRHGLKLGVPNEMNKNVNKRRKKAISLTATKNMVCKPDEFQLKQFRR